MTAGARTQLNPSASGIRQPGMDVEPTKPRSNGTSPGGPSLVREQGFVLGLVAEALDRTDVRDAATAIATELANELGCERVSIGVQNDGRLDLIAISNSADFDRKSNLVRAIEDAMQESCDQTSVVRYPSPDPRMSVRAHADLARLGRKSTIVSLPLVSGGTIGALLFQHSGGREIDHPTELLLSRIALLIAPILSLKIRAELPLRKRLRRSTTGLMKQLIGANHLTSKALTLLLIALTTSAFTIDGTARITATAALEPSESHAVVSPVHGYIEHAYKRTGDIVKAGTPLASLDLRDMELEQVRWQGELGKLGREYGAALAARDRSQQRILRSRQKQVHTQLALIENLMQRSHLTSPIDGVVVNGDLSEAYGSPVDRGQLLFEVAPLESYRVILNVDERDVAELEPGQMGRLLLAGKPNEPIGFSVKRIMPISHPEKGMNAFRVEAELESEPGWIRPGMVGTAKVPTGSRSYAWIYGHDLVNAIRLRLWQLGL